MLLSALRIGCWAILAGVLLTEPASAAVKLQVIHGRPVVSGVYVNGHGPYRFLVDTGTTMNHLDAALAESIDLRPTFQMELMSSTGATRAPGAEGVTVAVDSVQAEGQKFLFAGLDVIHRRFPEVQGVLGQVFLSRFDYLLDLRGERIEFGTRTPEAKKTKSPFQTVAGRPVVATNLGSLVLDSGAAGLTLFGVQATEMTHEMVTMTGSQPVGTVASKLVIDGRTFWRGRAVALPRSDEAVAVGLMPVSLFKTVYVCNSKGYVVLE